MSFAQVTIMYPRVVAALFLLGCHGHAATPMGAGAVPDNGGEMSADLGALAAASNVSEIHVSTSGSDDATGTSSAPFATVARAVSEIPSRKISGDLTVVIHAGTYFLSDTLTIDSAHSGSNGRRIIFTAAAGEAQPILSGGDEATGWIGPDAKGIYRHALGAQTSFRQLYSGDDKLVRARQPNVEPWNGAAAPAMTWTENAYHQISFDNSHGLLTPAMNIGSGNASLAELVIPVAWAQSRLPILNWAQTGSTAYVSPIASAGSLESEKAKQLGPGHYGQQRFYFEGHPSFVDQDGEWAIDVGARQLLVKTASPSAIVIPRLETLLSIEGASDVEMRNIRFSHSSYTAPSANGFISTNGSCAFAFKPGTTQVAQCHDNLLPAAVRVHVATRIRFDGCRFSQLGAIGLFAEASQSVEVVNGAFEQISSGSLYVKNDSDVTIDDNSFSTVGFDYGADAVSIEGATRVTVERNQLNYLAGRGFYVVSGGFFDDNTPADNVIVRDNTIVNAINTIIDAGAIDTGGSGITIEGNAISKLYNHGWDDGAGTAQAIYLDIGTYRSVARNNTIDDVEVGLRLNCQGKNTVAGNTISDATTQRIAVTFAGDCTSFLSGASKSYMIGLMQNAGCSHIGESNESCGCFSSGSCTTDSQVQP